MSDQPVTTDLLMQRLPGDLLTILLDPANPADPHGAQLGHAHHVLGDGIAASGALAGAIAIAATQRGVDLTRGNGAGLDPADRGPR